MEAQMKIIEGLITGKSSSEILSLILQSIVTRLGPDSVGCVWCLQNRIRRNTLALTACTNFSSDEKARLQELKWHVDETNLGPSLPESSATEVETALRELGFSAIHFEPIRTLHNVEIGVAAIAFRQPQQLADFDIHILRQYIRVGGLALERDRLEQENYFLAYHDYLTKIPNRRLFHATLDKVLHSAVSTSGTASLALLDLDNFKEVNDSYGHVIGDAVLEAVASRLMNSVRPGDTVARLGGDEFGIILPNTSAEAAVEVLENVLQALSRPLRLHEYIFEMRASAGISSCPLHGTSDDTLLRYADAALYAAKKADEVSIEIFK